MWIDQICRLCAQASEVLFPIFEKEGERPRLDIKIKKCLSLVVNEEDCKPKHICYNCTSKLEDYYEFLEICQTSDYKFESFLYAASSESRKWDIEKTITEQFATQNPTIPESSETVIVGKMDEAQNINRECQDIFLMVELKYKDVELDPQSGELSKQNNKIIYHEPHEVLHEKQLSVLRHSDDFRKASNKITDDVNNLDQISYSIPQNYNEQPMELIKNNSYNNCVQQSRVIKTVKSKPFPCNLCNKSFMRRSNLNAHMSVHTQIRPYHCEQCDRSFALRWNLTVHQRLHSGLYSCEFCGKAFPVKGKLERHRRIHTGEKPFCCNLPNCDKAFADKRNLEAHIKTHSEDRPYICAICSRGFRSRSHLSDHKRVHSSETPFTCDSCGKSFKWKTNLTIHMKNHTGEKCVCSECGKQFVRMTQLAKHKKIHHSNSSHSLTNKKNT